MLAAYCAGTTGRPGFAAGAFAAGLFAAMRFMMIG